jgi:hypothetical protein
MKVNIRRKAKMTKYWINDIPTMSLLPSINPTWVPICMKRRGVLLDRLVGEKVMRKEVKKKGRKGKWWLRKAKISKIRNED